MTSLLSNFTDINLVRLSNTIEDLVCMVYMNYTLNGNIELLQQCGFEAPHTLEWEHHIVVWALLFDSMEEDQQQKASQLYLCVCVHVCACQIVTVHK